MNMDDKLLNILLKNKLKVPSSSTVINNTSLETRLTKFSDIIFSDDIYVEKIPNKDSIIFDRYYLYNNIDKTVKGYYTSTNTSTGENYNVNGTISSNILYNNCKYITEDIWQEFINGNLDKVSITSDTRYNHIVKIENLKTNVINDTQNIVSPSYYNILLKDSILDTNGSKGYDLQVFGYSGLSNNKIDISNKDIGWIIHPETGIIQFLDNTAIINTNNTTINLFSTSYSKTDDALLNKSKTPSISFYRYIGFKGFKDFAKLDDIPSEIIVPFGSNITFLDSSNNIGSALQSTNDGGLLLTLNEYSSNQFNVKGVIRADKVISGRITLTQNTGTQLSGAFLPSGNDIFYTSGNVGIGTGTPKYDLDVYGKVHLSGPSKIVIQGSNDGGSGQGIFMNTDNDKNWGIYLASSGMYKSLSDGTSTSGYDFISSAMRFRSSNNMQNGFIWENSAEELLMSLKSDGSLYVKNTSSLNNVQIKGLREQGGVWLNLDGGNYGALYQNGVGTFGLVTTSQIQTSSNLEWGLKIIRDGATSLSYNGNEKIITNNTGIDIKNTAQIGDHSLISKNVDTVLSLNNYLSANDATYMQIYSDSCTGYNSTNGLLFGLNQNNVELTNFENGYIKIKNNNIDSIYINSNGIVGINTTNPKTNVNLDVNGNIVGASYYSSNNNYGGYWLASSSNKLSALVNTSNNDFGLITSTNLNSIASSNIQLYVIANSDSNNVRLYYNNISKLETQSNGIKINDNLNVLGTGSFSNIFVSSNIKLTGKLLINTNSSPVSLYINSNDAIRLPCGTTAQRPITGEIGLIRYNTDISGYEGYTNGNWTNLGGTQDIDGNTYISAEDYPGANNNQLKFYTNSNLGMILDSNQNIGMGTIQPLVKLHIKSTDGIIIPIGTTIQRPIGNTGTLRYNTTTSQFEGYGVNNWGSLGGVIDTNQDTYISAENTPGANNDELKFYTSNIQRLIINKNGNIDILSNLSVTGTTTFNSNVVVSGSAILLQDLRVNGNFNVGGTINYINSEQILVQDKVIQLASTTSGTSNLNGAGFIIGSNSEISLLYNDFTSNLLLNKGINVTGTTTSTNIISTNNLGIGTTTPTSKLHVIGDANITTDIAIGGKGIIGNTLQVTNATSLSNNLQVNGTTILGNTLQVANATSLSNNLNVTGVTLLSSNLIISGISTFNSNITLSGSNTLITGTGATVHGGTLQITGATALSNNLLILGTTNCYDKLCLNPNSSTSGGYGISYLSSTDTKYATYFTILGGGTASNSFNKNTSISYGTVTGSAIRNRMWNAGTMGFIWEAVDGASSNDFGLMALNSTSGDLIIKGALTASNLISGTGTTTINNNLLISGSNSIAGTLNVSAITSLSNNLIISNGKIGINTSLPLISFDINSNDGIKLPVGTTAQRPSGRSGILRYNSTTSQFEGYSSNNWGSLGGVIDVNQDTYISAETLPGINNDQLKFYTSNNQRMIIDSNGKIGININSPLLSLHINSNDGVLIPVGTTLQRPNGQTGILRYNNTTSQFEGYGSNNWGSLGGVIDVNQDTYISAETLPGTNNDQLQFYTSNIQRMLINSNGDVIIRSNLNIKNVNSHIIPSSNITYDLGSSNFRFRDLYLSGNSMYIGNTILQTDKVTGNITFNDSTNSNISRSIVTNQVNLSISSNISAYMNVNSNGNLSFFTSNLERFSINSNGNIGIGTNLPGTSFQVTGDISSSTIRMPRVIIGRNVSTNMITNSFSSNNNNIFYGDGNVGIGTVTPQYRLDIFGTCHIGGDLTIDNGIVNISSITTLNSNVIISGNNRLTTGTGSVNISGVTTLNSNLVISGSNTLTTGTGNVNISGLTTLNNNLVISGSNNLTIGIGSVNISGVTTLNSNLIISGSNTLTTGIGNVNISGVTTLNSNLIILGSNTLTTGIGNVNISGVTTLNSNLIILGSNTLTTGTGNINISGITTINSNVIISGSNTFTTGTGNINLSGITTLNSNINVLGISQFIGNVGIGTNNPTSTLHVVGDTQISLVTVSGSNTNSLNDSSLCSEFPLVIKRFSNLNSGETGIAFLTSGSINSGATPGATITHERVGSSSYGKLHFSTKSSASAVVPVTKRMTISETGNIGIGTATPLNKLHVVGDGQFTSNLVIGGITTLNGNVGIGTTNPESALHVQGILNFAPTKAGVHIGCSATNLLLPSVELCSASSAGTGIIDFTLPNVDRRGSIAYTHSTDTMNLWTSNLQRLTIVGDGDVGIGTTNPRAKLELNYNTTSNALLITNGDNSTVYSNKAQIAFGHNGTNLYNHFIHTRHNSGGLTENAIDFYLCNSTAANTITSGSIHTMSLCGGNVGINETNPTELLHIGTPGGTTGMASVRIDSPGTLTFTNGNTRQCINMGIETSTVASEYGMGFQSSTLYFRTTSAVNWYQGGSHSGTAGNAGGGVKLMQLSSAGNLTVASLTQTSDYRVKNNIVNVNSGLDKIIQLKPVTFEYNKAPGNIHHGFIAHELQEIIPDAVVGEKNAVDEDNEPALQSINMTPIVCLLSKAIQELNSQVQILQARIIALENKNE